MNQALFSTILNESRLAYWLCDVHLRILDRGGDPALQQAAELSGDRPPESILAWLPELEGMVEVVCQVARGDLPRLDLPRLSRTGADGRTQHLDLRLIHLNTSRQDGQGALLVLLRDVTEQGEIEQALMQQRNELALLKERLERQNQELAVRNLELEMMGELKASFVTLVAHELRTPLTVLQGEVEMLLDDGAALSPSERQERLRRLEQLVMRMAQAVQNLVDAVRIETDRVELLLVPTDLSTVLMEAMEEARPGLAARSAHVQVFQAPDLPDVLCDPRRTRQILTHLLGLVARHAPIGSSIQVRPQWTPDGFVEIQVTAKGLAALPLDTRPSRRGLSGFQRDGRWTDVDTELSLYIIRSLVELHGGHLALRRETGGHTVVVTFPTLGNGPQPHSDANIQPYSEQVLPSRQ